MTMKLKKAITITLLLTCGLAACSRDPFIMPKSQDAQLKKEFRKEKEGLSICYNNKTTDFREVMKMATEECARTRMKAVFQYQDVWQCALLTPNRAVFACVGTESADKKPQ